MQHLFPDEAIKDRLFMFQYDYDHYKLASHICQDSSQSKPTHPKQTSHKEIYHSRIITIDLKSLGWIPIYSTGD